MSKLVSMLQSPKEMIPLLWPRDSFVPLAQMRCPAPVLFTMEEHVYDTSDMGPSFSAHDVTVLAGCHRARRELYEVEKKPPACSSGCFHVLL